MSIRSEIDKAIASGADIEIEYFKSHGELSKRRVSGIEYNNDFGGYGYKNDHIKGYCHLRNENRTFKISRILSIRVLPNGAKVTNDALGGIVGTPNQYRKTSESGSQFSTRSIYCNEPSSTRIVDKKDDHDTSFDPLEYANAPIIRSENTTPKKESAPLNTMHKKGQTTSKGGCYIATMAYGNYDHPQVMVLRRYRDRVLMQSGWGRAFVRFYYWFSPKLVEVLKGSERINGWIRKWLDRKVERVKRRYDL